MVRIRRRCKSFTLIMDDEALKMAALSPILLDCIVFPFCVAVSNVRSSKIVSHWDESARTYTPETGATPWLPTGDSRTGIPFLLNKVQPPTWTRVWLPVHDGEVVALDIAFPVSGHDTSNPVYLVLHGLSGGSQEEYVRDFVVRRVAENATVAVMVARGLMDLPVRGMNVFHGARWEDPHQASLQLRRAILPAQLFAGVGFSMGAIILGNLVARTGTECALDVAVAISGGLDMRQEINFRRAQRLWQPLLTTELRDTFVVGKWGERVRQRLTKDEMKALMRATHISEIDETAVVAYHRFRDLVHYYSEMSVLGDVPYPSAEYSMAQLPRSRRM
jgi:predicted alpha/beta-fold hydrolase